ncbi:hypothetical protein PSACC_03714 [Paramicrosporidium saccamoebae]|uniref:UDP-galactose transporter homolog 1 n=1 Tax=Paramicrosporidium saccamoebae TaxID=1246581 RepID=A0A2H9TG07_9FUNG|nr:hypothetical protein PSACC_03714 [Paramicrosporidium saccamoebae]
MVGQLLFCAAGIYLFFLTWGVLQERISTLDYVSVIDGSHGRFRFFLVLNLIQSIACVFVAYSVLRLQRRTLGPCSPSVLKQYARVALTGCLGSPFGYEALRHINYPTMILGKSCKLIPVMLMNFVVYRRKFEWYKYVSVAMITAGVSGFMLFEKEGGRGGANSLYGLLLLLINLMVDGATNSWQDKMFIDHRLYGPQMMFFMHLFSSIFLFLYLLLNPWNHEFSAALAFARNYPTVRGDVALFGLCGALGQVFVFYTLEHFGSLSLVTITVTRKLFTILLSLLWFQHRMRLSQWLCVGVVFLALVLESFYKRLVRDHQKTLKT